MTPEASPFTPGQPVPVEYFVGRRSEVQRLRGLVRGAVGGRFKIGFVTGERGIGKSSLASFVRHLCEREEKIAGAHVFLGGVADLGEAVRRTFDRLLKESIEKPWHKKMLEVFGRHVRQIGLFGISLELSLGEADLKSAVHEFIPTLRRIVSKLNDDRAAILLILDDINGLANSAEFSNWLKSTVDEIATSNGRVPVCMLIVGLEERRQTLVSHQPSLARVFDLIEIRPWSSAESRQFFEQAFSLAGIKVDDEALAIMVRFAGGLPVLAHEIGDAVWRTSRPPRVTAEDAMNGVLGAAEVIGSKLLEPQVFQAIRSQRYRSILRKLAEKPFEFAFRRADVRERLAADGTRVLDNFLTRMKQLGAIVSDAEAGRGYYRFANQLHYLYFWIESQRARRERVS